MSTRETDYGEPISSYSLKIWYLMNFVTMFVFIILDLKANKGNQRIPIVSV